MGSSGGFMVEGEEITMTTINIMIAMIAITIITNLFPERHLID